MTQIYTVAITNNGRIEYLGHHIAGEPCPYCAAVTNTPLQSSKCTSPKACAQKTMDEWNHSGNTLHILSHAYRQKVTHQLYRKADHAARMTFGLIGV